MRKKKNSVKKATSYLPPDTPSLRNSSKICIFILYYSLLYYEYDNYTTSFYTIQKPNCYYSMRDVIVLLCSVQVQILPFFPLCRQQQHCKPLFHLTAAMPHPQMRRHCCLWNHPLMLPFYPTHLIPISHLSQDYILPELKIWVQNNCHMVSM